MPALRLDASRAVEGHLGPMDIDGRGSVSGSSDSGRLMLQDGPMNQDEYASLLREIRQRTRRSGRSDLDNLIMSSRLMDVNGPKEAVIQYLHGLRDDVALGGAAVIRESMRRLRRVPTEFGGAVGGIVIKIEESDQNAYGVDTIDLVGSPELDDAVREIDALIELLEIDGEQ